MRSLILATRPARVRPLLVLLCASLVGPAHANFCADPASGRATTEARLLESETFSQAPAGESVDFDGDRAYNARLITCNRKRDSEGNKIEKEIEAGHNFANNLEPKAVKGHFSYMGLGVFSKLRYAYQLERKNGTWIVTVPIEFHLPKDRMPDKIDIPFDLAQRLGLDAPGKVCQPGATVFVEGNARQVERGFIDDTLTPAQQALLIQDLLVAGVATQGGSIALDAVTDGSITDLILQDSYDVVYYPDETACRLARSREVDGKTIVHHLKEYWRGEIERVWNRPGFEIKPVMLGLDPVSSAERSAWEKDETIWPVHFNLKPYHRPSFKRWVAKWNHMYSGSWGSTLTHELGHYLGLDDEYGEDSSKPKDCEQILADAADRYLMCDADAERTGAQGVYAWILTRRYAVAKDLQCKKDSECEDGEYCDEGTLSVGRNQCKGQRTNGSGCTRAEHCLSGRCLGGYCSECANDGDCPGNEYCDTGTLGLGGNFCKAGKPIGAGCTRASQCSSNQCIGGFCSECASDSECASGEFCDKGTLGVGGNFCQEKRGLQQPCTRALQCQSGRCNLGSCATADECENDGDCDSDEYCDEGTVSLGQNTCQNKKANGAGCTRPGQCQSGRCPALTCAPENDCDNDNDCANDEYCDTGTAGIGVNQCKAAKSLGDACSRGGQCKSNCCKVYNFKLQCRPTDKCN